MTELERYEYDVCLSFASEQRAYVEAVADRLETHGVRFFYDSDERANLWGKDLAIHLEQIYGQRSRFCVLFASADYERKVWTTLERKSAQARALQQKDDEYILPVRFDDTRIPGLHQTIGYLDARTIAPGEVADLLLQKIRPEDPGATEKASAIASADLGNFGIHAPAGQKLRLSALSHIVDAMLAVDELVDGAGRQQFVSSLPSNIRAAVSYLPRPRAQLIEIVRTCERFAGGGVALREALELHLGDSDAAATLLRVIDKEWTAGSS